MGDRPNTVTYEARLAAAERIVAELVKAGQLRPSEVDGCAGQIAKHGELWGDGYALAKALDDWEHWDCTLDMAEILDGFAGELRNEIANAQKAWFEAEKPEPPFEPGARVAFKRGPKTQTGTIDTIYQHGVAQYLVKVDGDPDADGPSRARAIVNWEACVSAGDEASP